MEKRGKLVTVVMSCLELSMFFYLTLKRLQENHSKTVNEDNSSKLQALKSETVEAWESSAIGTLCSGSEDSQSKPQYAPGCTFKARFVARIGEIILLLLLKS